MGFEKLVSAFFRAEIVGFPFINQFYCHFFVNVNPADRVPDQFLDLRVGRRRGRGRLSLWFGKEEVKDKSYQKKENQKAHRPSSRRDFMSLW